MDKLYTPQVMLSAYAEGFFPMAEGANEPTMWYQSDKRGQIPIHDLHIPRSLKKTMRKTNYTITHNQEFETVLNACAEQTNSRKETWINDEIKQAFINLNHIGHAHSIEYRENGELKGGLYGLHLGGLFCGESMFSRTSNASKIALVHLCARLAKGGFKVLDAQFLNDHLEQFGAYTITHDEYIKRITPALNMKTDIFLKGISEKKLIDEFFILNKSPKESPQASPEQPHPQ